MTREECPLVVPCDDLKKVSEMLTDVRLQLREVVTEMRGINEMSKRIETVERQATAAAAAAEGANRKVTELQASIRWVVGVSLTAAGVISGIVSLIVKVVS
ncbi:hypothetical protein [Gorillibacterium sp. sgz500922]|uniref:hypothetical protein n=1 Tax=Gorillibacterium sp. sgz500922 TaxID=3446694 RepID=UPI003F66C386